MDAEISGARTAGREFDIELKLLIEAIYQMYHYDFRGYAAASLRRRMKAAMSRFDCETLSQLQDKVLHDPAVFPVLLDFLTVQVSEMFRDPAYFRALREQVVPLLRTYPSLKVWVAGCSAGEEAYSLAILLREEGLLSESIIYATDINSETLQKAAAGIYPKRTGSPASPPITVNRVRGRRSPISTRPPTAGRFSTNRSGSHRFFRP